MEYTQGYVAFIDILGFSNYVSDKTTCSQTKELFDFVRRFRDYINRDPRNQAKAAFFSDSIVITSSRLIGINLYVYVLESYLKDHLGLLFRGGICYGEYYHDNDITFGPAVVSAYRLEQRAIYSRIIIDDDISSQAQSDLLYFRDLDGFTCINPYALIVDENIAYKNGKPTYPDGDITKLTISSFTERKKELLQQIKKHEGTSVVDKYLWRIRPYNYTCNLIIAMPCGEILFEEIGYPVNSDLQEGLKAAKISEEDLKLR